MFRRLSNIQGLVEHAGTLFLWVQEAQRMGESLCWERRLDLALVTSLVRGLGCGFCMCRPHCLLRSNVTGSREWGGQKGECFKQASLRFRYCLQGLLIDRIFFSVPYLFPIRNVFVSWSSKRRVRVDFADEACGVQVHISHWFFFLLFWTCLLFYLRLWGTEV